jgi:transglutaminase-like putative cysteine protease
LSLVSRAPVIRGIAILSRSEFDYALLGGGTLSCSESTPMIRIAIGCELTYAFAQSTPLIAILNVHPSGASSLEWPDDLVTTPTVPVERYSDVFGNSCTRMVAPPGLFTFGTRSVVRDSGAWDSQTRTAAEIPVEALPPDTLQFLLGSRYCETDRLTDSAWKLFGNTAAGWDRVAAVCNFVHDHLTFGYEHSRPTRTAADAFEERRGVCRDYAHLAITLCRCLNIPARYCSGYVSDIGLPAPFAPQDFAAWIEVFLGGAWHALDPRNNSPRIGRVLVSRGRDAADVPLAMTFGPSQLTSFRVTTHEEPV